MEQELLFILREVRGKSLMREDVRSIRAYIDTELAKLYRQDKLTKYEMLELFSISEDQLEEWLCASQ